MSSSFPLPEIRTPDEVAEYFGFSERALKKLARKIGACRQLGKKMIFLEDDIRKILEVMKPCPSNSSSAARSGILEAPLTGSDYEALRKRLTAKQPSKSRRKSKAAHGNVISMARKPD